MRPLRFPGTFRWWIVAVLAVVFGFPLLPLAAWFTVAMPPLPRYYLLAYVESAQTAKTPGSTTPVRWLYITASRRDRALAMNPDVVSASGGNLPVRLSPSAANEGWTGIEMGDTVRVNSAQLAQFLKENFYSGRGLWTLMVEPILFGFAFILFLVAIALHIKERLGSRSKHEQRHGRRTRGPELLSSWQRNWKLKPDGIRWQLRWQNFLLDWFSRQSSCQLLPQSYRDRHPNLPAFPAISTSWEQLGQRFACRPCRHEYIIQHPAGIGDGVRPDAAQSAATIRHRAAPMPTPARMAWELEEHPSCRLGQRRNAVPCRLVCSVTGRVEPSFGGTPRRRSLLPYPSVSTGYTQVHSTPTGPRSSVVPAAMAR